jgi:sarcosine oxidase subunit alpha
VTSACHSPALGKPIGLALLRGGRARLGERIAVHDLGKTCEATIVPRTFLDPEGKRLHA